MTEIIDCYTYFIKTKGDNWKILTLWNETDSGASNTSNNKKTKIPININFDEKDFTLKLTTSKVPGWVATLKIRTNLSQSSKKFLQFTDTSDKKNPVVYGLGFDNEEQTKNCLSKIDRLKKDLEIKKEQHRANRRDRRLQNSDRSLEMSNPNLPANPEASSRPQNPPLYSADNNVLQTNQQQQVINHQNSNSNTNANTNYQPNLQQPQTHNAPTLNLQQPNNLQQQQQNQPPNQHPPNNDSKTVIQTNYNHHNQENIDPNLVEVDMLNQTAPAKLAPQYEKFPNQSKQQLEDFSNSDQKNLEEELMSIKDDCARLSTEKSQIQSNYDSMCEQFEDLRLGGVGSKRASFKISQR